MSEERKRDWRHLGSRLQAAMPDLEQLAMGAQDMATPSISTMGQILSLDLDSVERTSRWLAGALGAQAAKLSPEQAISESDRAIAESEEKIARYKARIARQHEILEMAYDALLGRNDPPQIVAEIKRELDRGAP